MTTITEGAVLDALRAVQEPELGRDIVTLDMVKSIAIDDDRRRLHDRADDPGLPAQGRDRGATPDRRSAPIGVDDVDITWGAMVRRAHAAPGRTARPGRQEHHRGRVRQGRRRQEHRRVNLAVALAQAGAAVGLLDADITGPNIPQMLGLEGQPKASANNKITPLERYGVKTISIQFFVPEGQPIVWRGPLVGGAIQQFLRDVDWGELDYLVIDLPPGTSDAQLTLAQAVPICGAVLVTTPQEVVLTDVGKALAMFQRMSVPVIGLVENMTAFACPHCGELTEIFGRGGGERFAAEHEPRVPRRHPARHHGPPGRRRRRARGRSARAGSGGARADRDRPDGRRADERPGRRGRRTAGPDHLLTESGRADVRCMPPWESAERARRTRPLPSCGTRPRARPGSTTRDRRRRPADVAPWRPVTTPRQRDPRRAA